MIDVHARSQVRLVIEDFLSDRIGAFEFDDRLRAVQEATDDETVEFVACELSIMYSDDEDHAVRVDKQSWDLIQRLLLLLESGAEFRRSHAWQWHASQLAAATALAGLAACWVVSQTLFAWSLAAAACSAVVGARRRVHEATVRPDPWRAWPFPSVGALQRALARTPEFRKRRYPRHIRERLGKSRPWRTITLPAIVSWPLAQIGWRIVAPLALCFQCFPLCLPQESFIEPHQSTVVGQRQP